MKKSWVVLMAVAALTGLMAVPVFAADKLVVKDAGGTNTVFVVQDTGRVGVGNATPEQPVDVIGDVGIQTNFRLTKFGGNPGAVFRAAGGSAASPSQVLADNLLGGFVAAGWHSGGAFSANKVGIYFRAAENFTPTSQGTYLDIETTPIGSTTKTEKMRITGEGNVGIGTTTPTHKLEVCGTSGCSYNEGGLAWIDASSREYKENIQTLSADRAIDTLKLLNPVTFTYKAVPEQGHVGFIAEDVPDLVAMQDRKGLSPLDIVAVLTKVVQEQNKMIEALSAKVDMLEKTSKDHKDF